jgi:hypothetical protein
MNWLTRQEQLVLGIALFLLLVGLAVKTYRTANPPGKAGLILVNDGTNASAGLEQPILK